MVLYSSYAFTTRTILFESEIVLYSLQVFRSSSLVLLAIVTFFDSWKVERQKRRLVSHGLLDFLMMIQC